MCAHYTRDRGTRPRNQYFSPWVHLVYFVDFSTKYSSSPTNLPTFILASYHITMSYSDPNGGYPPPPHNSESQYPPPPGEEEDRRAYHQRAPSANSNITLPAISPYDPQYAQPPNGYPDPRAYQADPYRGQQGGPSNYDARGYQQDYARGGPSHMAFSQTAPRQRTAIACRYCRRRKVSRLAPLNISHSDIHLQREEMKKCASLINHRFVVPASIKIPKEDVRIARNSNKIVSLLPSPRKRKLLFQHMRFTQVCAIWELVLMADHDQCIPKERNSSVPTGNRWDQCLHLVNKVALLMPTMLNLHLRVRIAHFQKIVRKTDRCKFKTTWLNLYRLKLDHLDHLLTLDHLPMLGHLLKQDHLLNLVKALESVLNKIPIHRFCHHQFQDNHPMLDRKGVSVVAQLQKMTFVCLP